MRHFSALLGIPLMLTLAACAQPDGASDGSDAAPDQRSAAFEQRATQVAAAWQAAPDRQAWQTGYVPLQEATVLPDDVTFSDETKQAFLAGWYREQVTPPTEQPDDGTIQFPDGTLTVPLLSAAQAYQEIDQGDPPPCPGRPAAPPDGGSPTGGPDDAVGSGPAEDCIPLTVTAVELGTTTIRTSRGEATVPAWLFSIDELDAKLARVAVAPSAVGTVPVAPPLSGQTEPELVSAQDLTVVDGAGLTYRLGVGACDENIVPLVQEHDDLVVVGGAVTKSPGVCTDQLLLEPVSVTLDAPLGDRPVLDALTGQVLLLTNN